MWSLILCRRRSLASPHLRNVGKSAGDLHLIQCSFLVSGSRRFSSVESVDGIDDEYKHRGKRSSFAVSYLVNKCGFSLESAKSRARQRQLHFSSPEKPDAVLNLLKRYGFTIDQINRVVNSCPRILISSADEIILPKLEFFASIGFLGDERTKFITSCPTLLASSLQNTLMPSYQALKTLLTPDEIMKCLKRSSRMLMSDVQQNLVAKVSVLSRYGLPRQNVKTLIKIAPRLMSFPADKFEEVAKRVIELGFDPKKLKFLYAVAVICQQQESSWEQKVAVLKSLGWSEADVLQAFKAFPHTMSYSEKKIRSAMDFFVGEEGISLSFLAKNSTILGLSLEERVRPRCSVMALLLSVGVLKKDTFSYPYILMITKKQFMDRFVTKYSEEVPQLLSVFEEKSDCKVSGHKLAQ